VWRRAFIGSWLSEYIDDEKATPPRACASAFPLRGAHYAYAGRLWQTLRLANALMDFGIATNLSAEVALVKSNARAARMAANRAMSCDLCLAQHWVSPRGTHILPRFPRCRTCEHVCAESSCSQHG